MSTWYVLQSPSSGYNDEPGISYEYPRRIPNGQRIKKGDMLIVVEPKNVSRSDKRILGWGLVDHVIGYQRNGKAMANAIYAYYQECTPKLSFADLGGDFRNNQQNAITTVPAEREQFILSALNAAASVPRNSEPIQLELPLSMVAEPLIEAQDSTQLEARKVRQGQGLFRKDMLVLYEGRCAFTGFIPNAVVDAAHIIPFAESKDHDIKNGLLLRSDLHNLFDDGLLRVEPARLTIEISRDLNSTPYAELHGRQLRPRVDGTHPSIELLDQHYQRSRGL